MKEKIIQQGAEAIILKNENRIIKRRVKKSYRYPELDEKIRKLRTRSETKLLEKAHKLIPTPKVLKSSDKEMEIDLEFIDGKKLSEHLDSLKNAEQICVQIGENIAKLHDSDIIHGDLTTSNMLLKDEKVYFIDYGLGFANARVDDKAVDLHLIKQALEAKHFKHFETFFAKVLEGYKTSKNSEQVLNQFKKVEKRGRYKEQY